MTSISSYLMREMVLRILASSFRGTLQAVNAAMEHLLHIVVARIFSEDSITIVADDQGNSGGESLQGSAIIDIRVAGVNDAPVISVPLREDKTKVRYLAEEEQILISGVQYYGMEEVSQAPQYESGFELYRSEGVKPDNDWEGWRGRLAGDIFPGKSSSSPSFFEVYDGACTFLQMMVWVDANFGAASTHIWSSRKRARNV